MDQTKFPSVCKAAAILSHYIWLVAFCWMSVVSFDVARLRGQFSLSNNEDNKAHSIYCLYAWLLPAVFVGVCVLIDELAPHDFQVGYSEGFVCWIGRPIPLIIVFLVPVCLILVFNAICFAYTVTLMKKTDIKMKYHCSQSYTTRHVVFSIQMSAVMGLSWILGFVDGFTQSDVMDYVFITVNSLQGMSIFVAALSVSYAKHVAK